MRTTSVTSAAGLVTSSVVPIVGEREFTNSVMQIGGCTSAAECPPANMYEPWTHWRMYWQELGFDNSSGPVIGRVYI